MKNGSGYEKVIKVLSQHTNKNDRSIWTVMFDFWIPLGSDIFEGRWANNTEAD